MQGLDIFPLKLFDKDIFGCTRDMMQNLVQNCDKCKRYTNIIHQSAHELVTILSHWPIYKRAFDIMEPFLLTTKKKNT